MLKQGLLSEKSGWVHGGEVPGTYNQKAPYPEEFLGIFSKKASLYSDIGKSIKGKEVVWRMAKIQLLKMLENLVA